MFKSAAKFDNENRSTISFKVRLTTQDSCRAALKVIVVHQRCAVALECHVSRIHDRVRPVSSRRGGELMFPGRGYSGTIPAALAKAAALRISSTMNASHC